MEEEFRDIPGYEGYYQASNFGRVKSLERYVKHSRDRFRVVNQKILKGTINGGGYIVVRLSKNSNIIMKTVHKIMHITFTDKFNQNKPCIDHIDRDRQNNHIDNLRECTHQENSRNVTKKLNTSSKYLGVMRYKNKWKVSIRLDDKKIYNLGYYKTEIVAGKIYDSVAKYYFKGFANLNFQDNNIIPISIEDARKNNRKKLSSIFRGVNWNKSNNRWIARISINKKRKYIGAFISEECAGRAYDKEAIKHFGEFANLNFPIKANSNE